MKILKNIKGTPFEGLFQRLRGSQDGALFKRYIEMNLAKVDEANRSIRDEVDLRRSQGGGMLLEDFLELLESKLVQR